MRFMVEVQNNQQVTKKLMTWAAVENFILDAVDASEYTNAMQYVSGTLAAGYLSAGWQWDNGNFFHISPFDVKAIAQPVMPVVKPQRRSFIYNLLTAILH